MLYYHITTKNWIAVKVNEFIKELVEIGSKLDSGMVFHQL